MSPPYQRRSVWNQPYKDDFIDTILLQYPAPAIFLYEDVSPEGVSVYQVVDGKQRLTSVFEFSGGEFPVSENSPLAHLRGRYFEQLNRDEKTAFWTYQFPIEYLPANDESVIDTIFQRINKNTARLTRQELRHARFGGAFITTAEELSDILFKTLPEGFPRIENQSKKQMKDVEFVANLLLSLEEEKLNGKHGIRGYSQDELDEAFSEREENWDDSPSVRTRFVDTVNRIRDIAMLPADNPISRTRLRNQADFYSLFTAVAESLKHGYLQSANEDLANRLLTFLAIVEDESARTSNKAAGDYFKAARSNSNDTGPRKLRHDIISLVLRDKVDDYASKNIEQVQLV